MTWKTFPKVKGQTLKEERAAKRLTNWKKTFRTRKPPNKRQKTPAQKRWRSHERRVKDAVIDRDGHRCIWPGCQNIGEGAHMKDKGMGGDKRGLRTQRKLCARVCRDHHRGKRSLHSKHLKIEPVDPVMLYDGPKRFWERDTIGSGFGPWREVA